MASTPHHAAGHQGGLCPAQRQVLQHRREGFAQGLGGERWAPGQRPFKGQGGNGWKWSQKCWETMALSMISHDFSMI
jgi:hypothetical protein